MWYEKVGKWLRKWWGLIASAALFIAGFFVGRGRRDGTDLNIEKLRADNEQLTEQVRKLRQTVAELRELDSRHREELKDLEYHLEDAQRALGLLRKGLEQGEGDLTELGETNRRLREYVEKHGARLREIQSAE